LKSIAKLFLPSYSELMAWVDPQKIRTVLDSEVPEFRISRSPTTVLGVLLALFLSVSLSAFVGVAGAWLLAEMMEFSYGDSFLTIAAVFTPILGFVVGYLSRDSLASPGSKIVERSLSREPSSLGILRDDRSDDALTGCFIFALQSLAGSVYASATQLFQLFGKSHQSERELAVSIVNHLLVEGRTATDKLAGALQEQGVPRDRTRSTVALLRKAAVLEPGPDELAIAPHKRHLFGA
jgi:hypothetical protein